MISITATLNDLWSGNPFPLYLKFRRKGRAPDHVDVEDMMRLPIQRGGGVDKIRVVGLRSDERLQVWDDDSARWYRFEGDLSFPSGYLFR